jgi:hydroxypyruvate reductase
VIEVDRQFLIGLFNAAVGAADPERALAAYLPKAPKGRTIVIGAGKGSAQLAAAFEKLWKGPLEGVIVTRYGFACSTKHIEVREAAHPVPDAVGLLGSRALFDAVKNLTADDLVVALISGGGSALLPMPAKTLSLEDEIDLNKALLASGAPISVMNAIRKQVSEIKGGRLALACYPARVVSLIVSDIPGDDPAQVASGPTVPHEASRANARALVDSWRIQLPPRIADFIKSDACLPPSPDDPRFKQNEVKIIASARQSLEAAARHAEAQGIPAVILSDSIEGESRDVGAVHAALLREIATRNSPFTKPVVILSGGETTVTIKGKGRGGRNSEFLLSLAMAAEGYEFAALAADTDGIDGSENNAGAFASGETAMRLRATSLNPRSLLATNDTYSAFEKLDDLFVPGPTGTNVNDFRAILIR